MESPNAVSRCGSTEKKRLEYARKEPRLYCKSFIPGSNPGGASRWIAVPTALRGRTSPRVRVRPVSAWRVRPLKGLVPLPSPTASAVRPPRPAHLNIPTSQSIIRLSTTTRSASSNQTNRPTSPSTSHHTTARTDILHPKGRLKYLSFMCMIRCPFWYK